MITEIFIPESLKDQYTIVNGEHSLQNINRVNIFIGPNNSAKSRLLRGVFINDIKYSIANTNFKYVHQTAEQLKKRVEEIMDSAGWSEASGGGISGVRKTIEELEMRANNASMPQAVALESELCNFVNELINFSLTSGTSVTGRFNDQNALNMRLNQIGLAFQNKFSSIEVNLPSFVKTYIPMLRGLRPVDIRLGDTDNKETTRHDCYKERTIRDYFTKNGKPINSLNIFTGLSMYEELTNLLLGKVEHRRKVRSFEEFLSKTFFDGQSVSLTPNKQDDCVYLTVGEEDRPIYDLGDGIQSIITLLYPLFFNMEQSLLCFIEEPELSLHPGMQRLFVDTIMKDLFRNHQFFITTHSNHFLDMILDHSQISIYNFKKVTDQEITTYQVTNTSNSDIQLLDSIGVRNSSVFLSNSTIWVEGICDRLYLNKYLELYQRSVLNRYEIERFKEDLHYSFIEYGGANVVHFSFDNDQNWEKIKASSISNRILVIMDEDGTTSKPTSKKASRIAEIRSHLGENLLILPCREIENTLSEMTLKKVLQALEKNDTLDCSGIKSSRYKDKYLGTYLHATVKGLKGKYASDSGTIADKVKFCKTAISQINKMDDLSESAQIIAKKIYEFIQSSNR